MKIGPKLNLLAYLLTAMACMMMLSSCDNAIYDDEGDCVVRYRVRFKYDYNMKFADAFPSEVEQVTLYVIDGNDNIVWQKTESGDALKQEGYAMDVDIAPGTYSLLAWCSSADPTTFVTGDGSSCHELKTDFHTEADPDGAAMTHVRKKLDRLYHGYEKDVEFPAADEGTFVYTVPLTKDTNHFVISLMQLSGEPMDVNDVEFEIIDDNAHLDWDNSPITGTPVTYHQWLKESVDAELGSKATADGNVNTHAAGVVAELTTSRLMMSNGENTFLRIYNKTTGKEMAKIRLLDAVLLVRGEDNRHRLTEQQYLDYNDEYKMTFFLNEDQTWAYCEIRILSWRVVYRNFNLDS